MPTYFKQPKGFVVAAYRINIIGLSQKVHHFAYELNDDFFAKYGSDLVSRGAFKAEITLDKRETFLEAKFHIHGNAELICDRSLETFDYPIDIQRMMLFKYGDEDQEVTDEMVIIPRETPSLDMGQYMYEFIALAIPMKKLHPRFDGDDAAEDQDGTIVYRSPSPNGTGQDHDPRWDQLKKLK